MQLNARDVCKHLNITEATLRKWIKQRGLPALHVAGQYRFNRSELLEWATANQVKVSLELFDGQETETEAIPTLAEALERGGIFYNLPGETKDFALRALIQVLPLPDETDRELLLRLFLIRESSASTAIGDGIAIPHVRNPIVLNVTRPQVTLGFLEKPVAYGALDGKPVHVLFSLVCPTARTHLHLLARLSFALHDARLKEVVTGRGTLEEILQEVRRVEAALASPPSEEGRVAQ